LICHDKLRSWLTEFLYAGSPTIRFFTAGASVRSAGVNFSEYRYAFTGISDV
jgi:hypothetical protein